MSKAFVPIVYHNNINHKYYFRAPDLNDNFASTCFWSGIYPSITNEKEVAYTEISDKLLCYDTCYVSINDYLYLVKMIGINTVNSLVSEGAIKIIDDKEIKIAVFDIKPNGSRLISFDSNHNLDLEKNVREYYRIQGININDNEYPKIIKNILSAKKIENHTSMISSLNEEISNDLLNPNIIDNLGLINNGVIVDRDNDYNQFLYNRIAYLNLYLYIINNLEINNLILPPEIQILFNVKTGAYINSNYQKELEVFSNICEVNNIANIPKAIQEKALDFNDILRIRTNKHAVEFRKWLEVICTKGSSSNLETQDLSKLYNEACNNKGKFEIIWEKKYIKTLKFAIPALLSLLPDPVTATIGGTTAGAAIFVTDTILAKKYRPNMFIDEYLKEYVDDKLTTMKREQENKYFIQQIGNIQRNELCPCGSGLKHKKCHGR